MTFSEIEQLCKRGKIGVIPGYNGYLKWDYANNCLILTDNPTSDLNFIKGRTDLYYII